MFTKVPDGIEQILLHGTPDQRKYVCFRDISLFARYYFSEHFIYRPPPYHFDFYGDVVNLINGELDEAMWQGYAESAKTSLAKIGVTYAICFAKALGSRAKRYINWDSYDKANAEAALFDIATTLQTNRKLIADFGQLYWKQKTETDLRESQKKSVASFITTNDVKLEAFSTQESTRGRVWRNRRPDWYIFDDFENNKTKVSYALTKKIKDHIDEARRGLGTTGAALYLCNYIVEDGVVDYIRRILQDNQRTVFRDIPVVLPDKSLAWPDKYVATDEEAFEINRSITNPRFRKISLETKERRLTSRVYQPEMMNNPGASGDYFFNRERIKELMEYCRPPMRDVGGLKIWSEYSPKHAFGIGVDTSEGKNLDANASMVINFSRRTPIIAATYQNNTIGPDIFGLEVKRHGELFGECIVGVESNNTGYATLGALKESGYPWLYVREVKNKTTGVMAKEYGLRMTSAVKYDILTSFRTAIEEGDLECWDLDFLKECYHYRLQDLEALHMEEGMTRHFDKLIAGAIAWEMRKWAKPTGTKEARHKSPQQEPWRP